jgi:hypothetical protein
VSASARYLAGAIAITAWIAISNHCTFAAVAPKPDTASACPFHSKPAKPQAPTSATQCCKILRAVATVAAKIPPRAIVDLPDVDLAVAEPIVASPTTVWFSGVFLDTGPPGTTSFAELIGSLQAHAPPLFA